MANRYISYIQRSHLRVAEDYRKWVNQASSDEQREDLQGLEATALALAQTMDINGEPEQGKVPLYANRRELVLLIQEKLGRRIDRSSFVSTTTEVRDDVRSIDSRFQGYLYRH